MKTLIAFAILAFSSGCASAMDVEGYVLGAMIVTDWAQTRYMTRQYDKGFYEKGILINALAGPTPSKSQVDLYFITRLALHVYVETTLPKDYRIFYRTATFIAHGGAIVRNNEIGIHIRF